MQTKAGFTMIESLFCLSIMMLLIVLSIPNTHLNKEFIDSKILWSQQIYETQLKAMTSKNKQELENTKVTFNDFGHINKATTILLGDDKCVFQLGSGRFYFE